MGFISDFLGGGAADEAAEASRYAAQLQAGYQKEALDYLKEKEALPTELREGALKGLAGAFGVEGGTGGQGEMVQRALSSPLYGALMGGREAGEEAILRSASATGGLRSGDVQSNMYKYNTQLENQALLASYNEQMRGLTGLSGLPSNANQIAQMTSNIGQTYAQGEVAAGQAQQQGSGGVMSNLMGIGQLGLGAFSAGMFSDRRLKEKIKLLSIYKGFNIYSWDWNKVANKMGLQGKTIGCMADEVFAKKQDAVTMKNHFMFVDYSKIGILI